MDKFHKLYVPISILVGCLVLGGFYYATEASKEASVERQQQVELASQQAQQAADLQAKQNALDAATEQSNLIASQKAECVANSERIAINMYENSSSCTGTYASADCTDGKTYLVPQFNNAYNICLEGKGLK